MIKPTLACALAMCLVANAQAQSFNYADFSSFGGISPVGLTTQAVAVMRLQDNVTPAVGGDNRGAAWYDSAVNVLGGFDTTFVFQMHTPSTTGGSDGMAFVIQNDQVASSAPIVNGFPDGIGNMAIGRHAAAAGFGQFTGAAVGDSVGNSLAIHLDTYNNGNWGDSNNNHISIHSAGPADNTQDESASLGRTASLATDLNDGFAHTMRVLYVPGTIEVYLDGLLELSVPYDFTSGGTWVDSLTPVAGLNLIGGTSAYVGFTSGAGGAREFRDVQSWSFASTATNSGDAYCFGDASGVSCPCSAFGATGEGCANTGGTGATLTGSGNAAFSGDSFQLDAAGVPGAKPGLVLRGNNQVAVPAGDGILCTTGGSQRSHVQITAAGVTSFTDFKGNNFGSVANMGAPTNFQFWYRDPSNTCSGGGFNFTNGWTVTYMP